MRLSNVRSLFLSCALLVAACRDPFFPPMVSPPSTDLAPSDDDPLASLRTELAGPMRVRRRAELGFITFLDGRSRPLAATPDDALRVVRRLFDDHAALFGRPSELSLRTLQTEVDELGFLHLRLVTQHDGRNVLGGEVRAHFSPTGELLHLRSNSWTQAPSNSIVVDGESARVVAAVFARQLRPELLAFAFTTLSPQIVLLPITPIDTRLCFRIVVEVEDATQPMRLVIFVDAETSEVRRWYDETRRLEVTANGATEKRTVEVVLRGGRLYLEDGSVATTLKTYTANNKERLPGTNVSALDVASFDPDSIDLHANLRLAYNYFASQHHLTRWASGDTIRATMRFGLGYTDAFFDGSRLAFGDGDGVAVLPLGRDRDVVTHELGHSVVAAFADLLPEGESGAIDEAYGDLFAAFAARHRNDANAWQVGEASHRCGGAPCPLRDLASPHAAGTAAHRVEQWLTYEDSGGVHYNSTIASHAGYLMAVGSATRGVPKLGLEATEQIWFRTLKYYLPSDADFVALAESTVAAATDLGYDAEAVRAAWSAVGITAEGEWL